MRLAKKPSRDPTTLTILREAVLGVGEEVAIGTPATYIAPLFLFS